MSTNLNAPALVGGQANPETTVNDAVGALDAAVTEVVTVNMTNDVSMTSAVFRSAILFYTTPVGSGKKLTLPAVKRLVHIANSGANAVIIKRGTTEISLAVSANGFFYVDGTANGLVQLTSTGGAVSVPYDVTAFIPSKPTASQVIFRMNAVRAFQWPSGLTNSIFNALTAATASYTLTLKKNGSSIGTLVWAASGTVPTVTFSSTVNFVATDVITAEGQVTPDTTLAGITLSFAGTR